MQPKPKPESERIESALIDMTKQITLSQDIRMKVDHIHDTQIRHDLRLAALEENQKEARDFRQFVRLKLDEMTGLGVKVALIMGISSLIASGFVGLIIKKI